MIALKKIMFNFKKKNSVRFTNLIPGVSDVYPVIPSSKFKFSWVSQCAKSMSDSTSNTAKCPGIGDLMLRGFILTAPFDFTITVNGKESFNWNMPVDPKSFVNFNISNYISYHNKEQLHQFVPSRSDSLDMIIKINTYWSMVSSDNLVFLQMPVPFPDHNLFSAVHGIIDSDKYHSLIIQLQWHRTEGTYTIKAGTPLCQLIPIERNLPINLNVVDATDEDVKLYQKYSYNIAHRIISNKSHWQLSTKRILDSFRKKFNI